MQHFSVSRSLAIYDSTKMARNGDIKMKWLKRKGALHELSTLYKIKHAGTQVIANKSSNIGKTTTTNQYRRVPDLWRPGAVKIKRYYAMHSFSFSPRRRFVFQTEISGKYSLLVLNSLLYFLFLSSPRGSVYRFLYTSYTPSTLRLKCT